MAENNEREHPERRPFPAVPEEPTSWVDAYAHDDDKPFYGVIECPKCGGEAFRRDKEYACRECRIGSRIFTRKANYGNVWEEVRTWVLERDGNECRKCGETGELEIHHKTKMAWFETIDEAHTPENLITLCGDCHFEMEHHGSVAPNRVPGVRI